METNIIPDSYAREGYIFTKSNAGDDDVADNDVNDRGYTAVVTPSAGENILTLDAGIYCECADVFSDSADAFTSMTLYLMIFMLSLMEILYIRRERSLGQL